MFQHRAALSALLQARLWWSDVDGDSDDDDDDDDDGDEDDDVTLSHFPET